MSESRHLGSPGEIVIGIEPAGPNEMAWLNTAAYGLSLGEEEVVEFVVRGASTRQTSLSSVAIVNRKTESPFTFHRSAPFVLSFE